jgi:hypothetical protein
MFVVLLHVCRALGMLRLQLLHCSGGAKVLEVLLLLLLLVRELMVAGRGPCLASGEMHSWLLRDPVH